MAESTKITATNREVGSALRALEALVKGRGFPKQHHALRVGRSIRRLRDVAEQADEARHILLQAHAKLDEHGKPVMAGPGGVMLRDARAFTEEITALERKQVEVEVWPIPLSAVSKQDGTVTTCEQCQQVTGLPEPEAFATLVDLGILTEVDPSNL